MTNANIRGPPVVLHLRTYRCAPGTRAHGSGAQHYNSEAENEDCKMGLKLKYFVLKPDVDDGPHARASRMAIIAYAKSISTTDEELARDLNSWVYAVQEVQMNELKTLAESKPTPKKDGPVLPHE